MKIYEICHENNSKQFPWLILARVAAEDEDSALKAWAKDEAYSSVEELQAANPQLGRIGCECVDTKDAIVLMRWDLD